MTDETEPSETGTSETGGSETGTSESESSRASGARRPGTNAAASAASRARRIGGARPAHRAESAGTPSAEATTGAVVVTKPDRVATTARPGRADDALEVANPSSDRSDDDGPAVLTQAPPWLKWTPAAVLALCAIVMAVLVAVSAHGVWYGKPSTSALRDRVLAAAQTCTAAANTYSYRTIPQDEARGVACSTGAWTDQYRKAMATLVKPLAGKLKASQSIQINTAGIETVGRDQWTVVVFGQTKVTQAKAKRQLNPFAAKVTMQRVGGKWLIAHIDLVNQATS